MNSGQRLMSRKSHSCKTYNKMLSNKKVLNVHQHVPTSKKSFVCNVCSKRFFEKKNLAQHYRTHTGEKPYICDICNKKFSQLSHLIQHCRTHSGEKPYTCEICKKKFSQQSHLIQHHRIHNGEKPYICKICKERFTQQTHLNQHHRKHTGERPFLRTICNKKFKLSAHLRFHTFLPTEEKPYVCKVCNKGFSMKYSLNKHSKIHSAKKPQICKMYNKAFTKKSNLDTHMFIPAGEKCHISKKSNKTFNKIKKSVNHKTVHTEKNLLTYEVSGKRFRNKCNLDKHIVVHSKEKPETNKLHNKKNSNKSELDECSLVSNKQKIICCDVCNKSFSDKSVLNRHYRLHSKKKAFGCGMCNEFFSERSDLNNHYEIHKRENFHLCKICNKCFYKKYNLNKHLLVHSREKVFTCELCNEKFSNEFVLDKHKAVQHEKIPPILDMSGEKCLNNIQKDTHIKDDAKKQKPDTSEILFNTEENTDICDVAYENLSNVPIYSKENPPISNMGTEESLSNSGANTYTQDTLKKQKPDVYKITFHSDKKIDICETVCEDLSHVPIHKEDDPLAPHMCCDKSLSNCHIDVRDQDIMKKKMSDMSEILFNIEEKSTICDSVFEDINNIPVHNKKNLFVSSIGNEESLSSFYVNVYSQNTVKKQKPNISEKILDVDKKTVICEADCEGLSNVPIHKEDNPLASDTCWEEYISNSHVDTHNEDIMKKQKSDVSEISYVDKMTDICEDLNNTSMLNEENPLISDMCHKESLYKSDVNTYSQNTVEKQKQDISETLVVANENNEIYNVDGKDFNDRPAYFQTVEKTQFPLDSHLSVHTKEEHHVCGICTKGYAVLERNHSRDMTINVYDFIQI